MANDFLKELEVQRGYLLRVARLQLRDTALAEDVVQDTLAAALTAQGGFTGKSSVKTWLTGILKHKIVDAIRKKQREPVAGRPHRPTGATPSRPSTASSSST